MSLKSYKNAFLKRKVFSLCLKRDTEEVFLMSDGRVFQSVGAATEKDLAPYVFKLKCVVHVFLSKIFSSIFP